MPLVLVEEDGTGLANANSYASVADGDDYFLGHLYATDWTGASTANKTAALVMATRLIDVYCRFRGQRLTSAQALAWPRSGCPDPELSAEADSAEVASDTVPRALSDAACETARALILEDRTANPLGEGLKWQTLGDLQQTFDKADRRPVLPHVAQRMLERYAILAERVSGSVPLIRT